MTVMHLSLELTAKEADYTENGTTANNYADSSEWQQDEEELVDAVDLLNMDEPSPVGNSSASNGKGAAAGSNSESADPFGADPFGDPFAEKSSTEDQQLKQAPPLTEQQHEQHRTWLTRAMANAGGPLYDDGNLQVATKIEVRLSQAKVSLFYRNNGPGTVSNLQLTVDDPAGLLRYELSSAQTTLEPMSHSTAVLIMECMKPAAPGPSIQITYTDSIKGRRNNTIAMPINTATFNDPLTMGADDFNSKWNQLTGAGQAKQDVFSPSLPIVPSVVLQGMTKMLKFGKVSNMPDESEYVIYGASSLKTGAAGPNGDKISVGCLVKIEMNVQRNAVRLTARTLHPAATAAIFECARTLLG